MISIFISHSSRQEPVEKALLELLRKEVGDNVKLLLDQDLLRGGDDWRQEIHTWMGVCQAAVILFSPGVLAQPKWVRKEAFILEWRQTLDPKFLLIPVLMPGFTRADLAKVEFDPAHLDRLQLTTDKQTLGETAEALCGQILAALKPLLEGAVAANALGPLVDSLAAELAPLTVNQCAVACTALAAKDTVWTPVVPPHEQLAYALMNAPLSAAARTLSSLDGTLKERTAVAASILAAFWVRAEAASRLLVASRRPPGCRSAVLNTDRVDIADYYIWRALSSFLRGKKRCSVQINDPEHPAMDVYSQVIEHFRQQLPGQSPKSLPAEVARRCGTGARESFFLLLAEGSRAVPQQAVEEVRSCPELKGSTLMLLSPPTFDRRLEFTLDSLEFVEPQLDEKTEEELNQFFSDALV